MPRQRMTMRALVERNTEAGIGPDNLPLPPVFAPVATVPCWVWSKASRQLSDGDKLTVIEDMRALFPAGANVAEGDEISSVTDRQGVEILPGRVRIDTLARKPRHLEAMLQQVR